MKKLIYIMLAIMSIAGFSACKKEKQSSGLSTFVIAGSASSSFNTADENNSAKTFLDLTNHTAYNYSEALNHQATTDIVLRTSYYNGTPPTGSSNVFASSLNMDNNGAAAWAGNGNLDDFGVKNSTIFAAAASVDFDAIIDAATLMAALGKVDEEYIKYPGTINGNGAVFAFKTQAGKSGVLRVINYIANKPFSFSIEFKMQQ